MRTGTVRWFSYSNGCGFIIPDDGSADVFAHFSEFRDADLPALHQHQRVRFSVQEGPKGSLARDIR
jgi:cold shock protein